MSKKPHNQADSQDQQTTAPKKPGSVNIARNNAKREARLAEALRANLRRRKSREQDEKDS